MPTFPFLSPEWVEEATRIREEFRGQGSPPATTVRMNQVITDVPFGDGTIEAHMDSTSGEMEIGLGHLDAPEVEVTIPYGVAKAIFVDGDAAAGMQAFMAGQIKVQGDMTKLMAVQGAVPDETDLEVRRRLQAITADPAAQAGAAGQETHPFLSPGWIEAVRAIRESHRGQGGGGGGTPIKMNQVITEVPFGDGTVDAHMDTTSGEMEVDLGHVEDADVKITVPYQVAKAIFVDGNPQIGMQAFMAGQIKVEGDMTKLLAMQGSIPDAAALEVRQRIQAVTSGDGPEAGGAEAGGAEAGGQEEGGEGPGDAAPSAAPADGEPPAGDTPEDQPPSDDR